MQIDESDVYIHHIGYAVASISGYYEQFLAPLVSYRSVSPITEDPIQRVRVMFVNLPGGTIELIEPMDDAGPINEIIRKRRGGLYHLCFATKDFDAVLARFCRLGCRALSDPVPAAAFGQRRLVFVLSPERDLFELIEMV